MPISASLLHVFTVLVCVSGVLGESGLLSPLGVTAIVSLRKRFNNGTTWQRLQFENKTKDGKYTFVIWRLRNTHLNPLPSSRQTHSRWTHTDFSLLIYSFLISPFLSASYICVKVRFSLFFSLSQPSPSLHTTPSSYLHGLIKSGDFNSIETLRIFIPVLSRQQRFKVHRGFAGSISFDFILVMLSCQWQFLFTLTIFSILTCGRKT